MFEESNGCSHFCFVCLRDFPASELHGGASLLRIPSEQRDFVSCSRRILYQVQWEMFGLVKLEKDLWVIIFS